jgi:hypothetical protein
VACIDNGGREQKRRCRPGKRRAIFRREREGRISRCKRVQPAQATAPRWPRLVLLIVAAIEFLTALSDLPVLFGNLSEVPGLNLGGAVIIAKIALSPLIAFAAVFFVIRGRIFYAIVAMAVGMLLTSLSFLPTVIGSGFTLTGADGAVTIYEIFVVPVIAIAAVVLGHRGRLTPAILLAVLPALIGVAATIAFAIGVAIYGF